MSLGEIPTEFHFDFVARLGAKAVGWGMGMEDEANLVGRHFSQTGALFHNVIVSDITLKGTGYFWLPSIAFRLLHGRFLL